LFSNDQVKNYLSISLYLEGMAFLLTDGSVRVYR